MNFLFITSTNWKRASHFFEDPSRYHENPVLHSPRPHAIALTAEGEEFIRRNPSFCGPLSCNQGLVMVGEGCEARFVPAYRFIHIDDPEKFLDLLETAFREEDVTPVIASQAMGESPRGREPWVGDKTILI